MDTWGMIADERGSLVEALAALPDDAWSQPSLCEKWTVKQVAGHMAATGLMTPGRFFKKLVGSGFSFEKMSSKDIAEQMAKNSPDDLVAELRSQVDRRNHPPGPSMAMLGEVIIHGEDIFRSRGAYREHKIEHVVAVADFFKNSNLIIGAKKRIDGLNLSATDTGWEHPGGSSGSSSGDAVSGPMIALVMAMVGRKAALDDLTGPGVELLRSRP
jgi:uncharacterized protein (TIGR03083 family)